MELPAEIEMAVFETAIQLGDERLRKAYLDFTFRDSPGGRAKIQALLDAEHQSRSFFHEASLTCGKVASDLLANGKVNLAAASAELEGLAGQPIALGGRYQIISLIGEGSGGLVYLAAQHEPVCRRVAIKILRFGVDSPQVIATFEREGQALALMNHPHIAQIFDVGASASGQPFFVMELVEGERITRFCDSHQFGIERRLELFIQVCGAIQHAHQKGIIHRDIKPSNLLVVMTDGQPMPKVIDFGIAKATAEGLSGSGVDVSGEPFIGTPAYMSPEQAENGGRDVDTRSDIYALGVLLYELLTGSTPHDPDLLMREGVSGLSSAIRRNPILRPTESLALLDHGGLTKLAADRKIQPGRLIKALRGDLDAIVMKALSMDRQARYATVNNFATDLRRHLDWLPVTAHASGTLYHCRKFLRRNRLAVSSVSGITVALIVGSALAFLTYLRELETNEKAAFIHTSEAALRQQAEAREVVSKVAILINDGKIDEADALLQEIPLATIQPSLEAAKIFRYLGDRNAVLGRWDKASQCFVKLMEANRLESPEKTAAGLELLALAVLEGGSADNYDRIRREMLERIPEPKTIVSAEPVMRTSLLLPPDGEILRQMEPMAVILTDSVNRLEPLSTIEKNFMAWNAQTLALFESRRGNHSASLEMAKISNALDDSLASRNAANKALSAMALHGLGKPDLAISKLMEARQIISSFSPEADGGISDLPSGACCSWNSRAFATILAREAGALLDE
jgi:serine/threonine protein kinase